MPEVYELLFDSRPLLSALAVLEVGLIILCSVELARATMKDQPFLAEIRERVLAGEHDRAIERAAAAGSAALARVVELGLRRSGEAPERVEAAMDGAASELLAGLGRRLSVLVGLGALGLLIGACDTVFYLLPRSVNVADISRFDWAARSLVRV